NFFPPVVCGVRPREGGRRIERVRWHLNPSSPRGGNASGGTCRTYPTSSTDVETNPSAVPPFTLTNTYTTSFNSSTNQIMTTGSVTSSTGCAGPFTTATTWNSVSDFVAEVAVIPPLLRAVRTEMSANTHDT